MGYILEYPHSFMIFELTHPFSPGEMSSNRLVGLVLHKRVRIWTF